MKLLIAVPSKGRADKIIKHTMRWLPRTGFEVRVFVEPQEIEKYKERLEHGNYDNRVHFPTENVIDIGENDKGLGYAMKFIKQYAIDNGFELVFKMDDDVLRFNSRGKNKSDDEMVMDFAGMVGQCRKTIGEYPDVGAISFPYRNELFEPKKWVSMNTRLQTCYIIRTELMQDGTFDAMEDFAQYVLLRKANKVILRYGLLGIDCADVGKNKGGHQMFDRGAKVEADIAKLREIHPAIQFKKVEGKTWAYEPVLTGDFFGVKKL